MNQTPVVKNKREFAGYTHGYNHSVFAKRARKVLADIIAAQKRGDRVNIITGCGSEPIALAAVAATTEPGTVNTISLGSDKFRFADITSYRTAEFIPGAVKYGDLPGLIETVTARGATVKID